MSNTVIDDQDTSQIDYHGAWAKGGSSKEYKATVASSTTVGDFFIVSFYGNAISVYGTIDITSAGVQSNYSIDRGRPETATSQAGSGDTYNQQFWRSAPLNLGKHTLNVTMVKVNQIAEQPGEGTIWFDYFLVTDPTIRKSQHGTPAGVIAGSVVGALAFLSLVFLLFVVLKRRRTKKLKPQPLDRTKVDDDALHPGSQTLETQNSPSGIIPFVLRNDQPNNLPVTQTTSKANSPYTLQVSGTPRTNGISGPSSSEASDPTGDVSAVTPVPHTKASKRLLPPDASLSSEGPVLHIDSGVRHINPADISTPSGPVELPPVYSAV